MASGDRRKIAAFFTMPDNPLIASALDDRYDIQREIGAGGMAVVYLARDRKLDRDVALKVLRPELGAVLGADRFLAEIKISARLDHPHILTLIDSGDANGFLYYVLPFVRGESLRAKLEREHQLPIDEAIAITTQVASALDYAHRQGLVHRDIKPENILIQEGEAMLTDFGIALAVKEAGGNRLTQTGLSLGTPQYMSPEQATGDRSIDARSDVYSLAAVLYEMLAGEPPVTGANAQAMIAKLMTERPTSLRILRDTVPAAVGAAVAKALAKTPADRFNSAGEFARALTLPSVSGTRSGASSVPERPSRKRWLIAAAILVATAGAAGAFTMRDRLTPALHSTLVGRVQLTSIGNLVSPAISPDGKQLAYGVKHCLASVCDYSIVLQDVGGTATRALIEHVPDFGGVVWSPDRRNLLMRASLGDRFGIYLLSAIGGTPKFLSAGAAAFYAGGDSLLIGSDFADSAFYMRVSGLDGIAHDSIRVREKGHRLALLSTVPDKPWILALVTQESHGVWTLIDRSGKVIDRLVNSCVCGGVATKSSIWLQRANGNGGSGESIVRVGFDPSSGRFSPRQDTMTTGLFTSFSLTADGSRFVMDEGVGDATLWALDVPLLIHGTLPDERKIEKSSRYLFAMISPDGNRLLFVRRAPATAGGATYDYSVRAYAGGPEMPLAGVTNPRDAEWIDSVTVAAQLRGPKGTRLAEVDVRSGAQRNVLDVPDTSITDLVSLRDGWAWIPEGDSLIVLHRGARDQRVRRPAWYSGLSNLAAGPDAQHVFVIGTGTSSTDSAALSILSLADGGMTRWAVVPGRLQRVTSEYGTLVMSHRSAKGELDLLEAESSPGHFRKIGTLSTPGVQQLSISADLKRATVIKSEYHADAWLSKVIAR